MKSRLLNKIIKDLDETYQEYLKFEGLDDRPVIRAGFYATAVTIVMEDPMDDQEVQTDIMLYALNRQGVAVNEIFDPIYETFKKVARGE